MEHHGSEPLFQAAHRVQHAGLILPIAEIPHPEAEAVIGGFVYHGSAIPGLQGQYIFGDLNGKIWSLQQQPSGTFTRTLLLATPLIHYIVWTRPVR